MTELKYTSLIKNHH